MPRRRERPGGCSGALVVRGTRVMVEYFLDNTDGASVDEIAEMFGLPVDAVILAFEKEARLQRAMQAGLGAVRGIFIKAQSNLMRQLRALPRDRSAARKRGGDHPPT